MGRFVDETGNRHGQWTVLRRATQGETGVREYRTGAFWVALCDCGQDGVVSGGMLRNGTSASCGHDRKMNGVKDRRSDHYLYKTWAGIKARCTNIEHRQYHSYGGRGIELCPAWLVDPLQFFDWVDKNLGPRPAGHSLDRIDNNAGYLPGNLRWADSKTQSANRRSMVELETRIAELELEVTALRERLGDV